MKSKFNKLGCFSFHIQPKKAMERIFKNPAFEPGFQHT